MARSIPLAVLVLLAAVSPAWSGVVRGTIRFSRPEATTSRTAHGGAPAYPGRADAIAHAPAPAGPRPEDVVVSVEKVPRDAPPPPAARAAPRLSQRGQSFVPRVLAVRAGATVEFPNEDPIYHNVFSLSPVQRFDLGKYPRGSSKSVTFRKPGLVKVYCDIHSDMEAFVVVLSHPFFAQPAASGAYVLPALPPGRYMVRAWHPDRRGVEGSVDVPAEGEVALDLEL